MDYRKESAKINESTFAVSQIAVIKVEGVRVGPGEIVRVKDDSQYGHHKHDINAGMEELSKRIQALGSIQW